MPLRADKLPISHNNVVGENTVGDWCSHTRGSELISKLYFVLLENGSLSLKNVGMGVYH